MDLFDYCLHFVENEIELLFVWLCLMKMRRHMETKRFLTITIEYDCMEYNDFFLSFALQFLNFVRSPYTIQNG